ncbi:MAG TPA: endonuclease/exonuclease/phosphatase family protein, partial [Pirellulaceae bacterium]|nr:endonuclease/exonuclease/phosphatase family protein [Pirellulaceae bacterium]
KEFLAETIKAFSPDLLGTQETLGFQRDFLAGQLADYGVVGVGRDDGQEQGEMMALYFRRERFEKLGEGHFWLSETPDVSGSKSWDSSLPRMVTWVKLQDRQQPGQPPLWLFNTHFDHRGPQARLHSAELLRKQIGLLAKGDPVIVTGDFNSGEASEPYRALFAAAGGEDSPVIDCFRAAHPERGASEGTASGFEAKNTGGARIDWIACSRHWEVRQAEIVRAAREGRTPSDHFPVTVVLQRK